MRRAAAALALAALAACSSGGSKVASTPPTSTTGKPRPTSTAPATTTSSTTTTAPLCAFPTNVPVTVRPSQASGGLSVYGTGTDAAPGPWFAAVDGTDGRRVAAITDAEPDDSSQQVRALGATDDHGTTLYLVAVGNGASALIVGLFTVEGCDLVRLTTAGKPATFAIGGTVVQLQGLRCAGGGVEALTATSSDGVTYSVQTTSITVTGTTLALGPPTTTTATAEEASANSHLDCPGIEPV